MTTARKRSHAFLLISGMPLTQWNQVLQRALASLGELQIASEEQAVNMIFQNHYDVVIIDAGPVRDAVSLVSRARASRKGLRIVVVTASPTWLRAREVLLAGATDYIRKSLDEEEIQAFIKSMLELPPLCNNR